MLTLLVLIFFALVASPFIVLVARVALAFAHIGWAIIRLIAIMAIAALATIGIALAAICAGCSALQRRSVNDQV